MAIDINELDTIKQKEAEEKQRREEDLISEQSLRKLESCIDARIKENYTREKMWFSKKTKIKAKFSFTTLSDAAHKIDVLIQHGSISAFLERYRQKGWVVRCWHGLNYDGSYLWLSFTKIIDAANHESAAGANRELETALNNKRKQLIALKTKAAQIQLEIHRLEAEVQMLTESPNSRDPLLLPETAGE